MTGAVATRLQKQGSKKPFHMAMLIPMMAFVCAWVYPIYVNFFNRETMDVRRDTAVGVVDGQSEKERELIQVESASPQKHRAETIEHI